MARIGITALVIALLSPLAVRAIGLEGALLDAARNGDTDAVKALAVRGVDLETRGERGERALHLAAAYGHVEVVKALVAAGADIGAAGPIGNTPLHYAAQEGFAEIAALLVAAGADTEARSDYGTTPLSMAQGWGHREVVAALAPVAAPAPGPSAAQWLVAGLAGVLAVAGLPVLGLSAGRLLADVPHAHIAR